MIARAPRPLFFAGTLAVLSLAACQSAPAPAPPVASPAATVPSPSPAIAASPSAVASSLVEIGGTEYAFNAPATIPSGWTTIRFTDTGRMPHHVQLMRLNDNVTFDQFGAAMQQGVGAALALVSLRGGVAAIVPSESAEATVNLPAGQYVLICLIPDPDGVPHAARGMLKPLQVTSATGTQAAPTASSTVTMRDFTYDLPQALGHGQVQVTNAGPQPHEMSIVKLPAGKTAQDIINYFNAPPAGPPPFQEQDGGMQGLDANGSGFANLNLQPGNYAAICLIPDSTTGKPHAALGMARDFTVQ